jgi:hypothetical protein
MYDFMRIVDFAKLLFVNEKRAIKASEIIEALLEAQSPRISDIADRMSGNYDASYKSIQRFLKSEDLLAVLHTLFNDEAEFVIGDPTEIERGGAKKTDYVGTLKDGKTRGFWMLTLATPIRGRAIPCHFTTYSSATIASEVSSRNLQHQQAIREIALLVGKRPVVLDREFSYLGLLEHFHAAEMAYVIRLNQGSKPPKFYRDTKKKEEVKLMIAQNGKEEDYHQLYYKGEIPVNLSGIWGKGFKKPLWVMTNLSPQEGMRIYQERSKIETSFRDQKSILNMDKVMNKTKTYLERMLALLLIAYAIALLVGEAIRDVRYAETKPDEIDLLCNPQVERTSKWYSFSGIFILLKRRRRLDENILEDVVDAAFNIFANLVDGKNVRSFVPT